MRIIYLSTEWTLLLCFIVWPILQIVAAIVCLMIPNKSYSMDSIIFRSYDFEKEGKFYDRIFRVSRWKHLLPDGEIIWNKNGFNKKHLENFSNENLERFLIESARGELTHWLAIIPFWIFGFFTPSNVIWLMLIYALAVNFPCIITQRYNRPRVQKLLNRKNFSNSRTLENSL